MIEMSKTYQNRDKNPVTVLSTTIKGAYPVLAVHHIGDKDVVHMCKADGKLAYHDTSLDLIEIPRFPVGSLWLTRNDCKARILANDIQTCVIPDKPLVVAVKDKAETYETVFLMTSSGNLSNNSQSRTDLISPVPQPYFKTGMLKETK